MGVVGEIAEWEIRVHTSNLWNTFDGRSRRLRAVSIFEDFQHTYTTGDLLSLITTAWPHSANVWVFSLSDPSLMSFIADQLELSVGARDHAAGTANIVTR